MKTNWSTKKLGEQITMSESLEKKVKRGKESWTFIYATFGILIALFTFFTSIIPINWIYKTIIFVVTFFLLIYLCLCNAWFQNKLIGLKIRLEETWRKI